jgi:hypothetical protein
MSGISTYQAGQSDLEQHGQIAGRKLKIISDYPR